MSSLPASPIPGFEPANAADATQRAARETREAQETQEAIDRVLASSHFAKAPLLSSFLRFVGESALAHPEVRITEQEIGVLVFHRAEDYDPGEDNIVRNYARQLRRRLEAYYREEGTHDPIRIEIPKGGYNATFHRAPVASSPASAFSLEVQPETALETQPVPAAKTAAKQTAAGRWLGPVLILLAALLVFAAGTVTGRHFAARPQPAALHPLWATLFQPDRNTIVVPADIAYVILQQLDNRTYSLADYLSWSPVERYDHVYTSFLKAQKYTSMLDLETVTRIERLPEIVPSRLFTRSPHAIAVDDLSNANCILLGSSYSNPWVGLFEPRLNFRFKTLPQQGRSWIENTHPRPGESPTYEIATRNIAHETFAVVAFVPNLANTGHVLIVEGIDGPGTLAAVDLLMQGDAFKPILRQATRSDGRLGAFEVLIAATSLDSRSTSAHIIAQRLDS